MTENYSEIVERLRKYTLPGTDMRLVVAEEVAAAIAALQLKLADAQASAEASARRVVRAEAVVEAARTLSAAESHYRKMHDLHGDGTRHAGYAWDRMRRAGMDVRDALDRLDQQDSEQEKSNA